MPIGVEGRIGLGGGGPVVRPGVGMVGEGPGDVTDCEEPDPVPAAAFRELDHKLGELIAIIAIRVVTDINTCFRAIRFDPSP